MAIEVAAGITALLGAAEAVNKVVKEAKPAIQKISSGMFGRAANEEAKAELDAAFTELEGHLRRVGELARLGEQQARLNQDVHRLLWDCERARAFMTENFDDASDRKRPGYESAWRIMDTIFDSIEKRDDLIASVQADSARWFDAADRQGVVDRVTDYAEAKNRASESVQNRAAITAQARIDAMCAALDKVTGALNRTMYDKVFHDLQLLGK
jgi:hypothetical protein